MSGPRGVLLVGLVCLDDVLTCDHYPHEDEDMYARERKLYRGGNAANSAVVLAELIKSCKEPCDLHVALLANLAKEGMTEFLCKDLESHGVRTSLCPRIPDCHTPTSFIIRNMASASRTIVHHSDLPELTLESFTAAPLQKYCWLHLEARRQVSVIRKMLEAARAYADTQGGTPRVSLELEKPHAGSLDLVGLADVVFFSKDYARAHGHDSAPALLQAMRARARAGAVLVCAWGESGADGVDGEGHHVHADAHPPEKLQDTLGAGDTFNAAVILALARGRPLLDALQYGCRVAGAKCGVVGMDSIGSVVQEKGIFC